MSPDPETNWRDLIQTSTPEARAAHSWAMALEKAVDRALDEAWKAHRTMADAYIKERDAREAREKVEREAEVENRRLYDGDPADSDEAFK